MAVSHLDAIAGIERGLAGDLTHALVDPADARGIVLHVIIRIGREFVVDRLFLLNRLRLA